jgi:hypothetical protein
MSVAKDQEIIRLWNRLRALRRKGQSIIAALLQLEQALAEREPSAASSSVPDLNCFRSVAGRSLKGDAHLQVDRPR